VKAIKRGDEKPFLDALQSNQTVSGSTHTFYRYPARFSPEFAREAVRLFSQPGDLVLDPFMGGGTAAVEALAEGRTFCGNDINELAYFVSKVKTTVLSLGAEAKVVEWASALPAVLNLAGHSPDTARWDSYLKHIPWRLRKLFAQGLETLEQLDEGPQRDFARCSLLVTGQWALDCKTAIPSKDDVIEHHQTQIADMIAGSEQFRKRVQETLGGASRLGARRTLMCGDSATLHKSYDYGRFGRPKLILTSPPYLGVHVLYHRWQILGRRETGAPYWIANASDGHSGVFYTLADRRPNARERYLARLRQCFASVRKVMAEDTAIVQLVAFSDPDIELPLYLNALEDCGLEQRELPSGARASVRRVPNRKWYAYVAGQSQSSTEFLLIHRQKRQRARGRR
jgi:DNA modification methylase